MPQLIITGDNSVDLIGAGEQEEDIESVVRTFQHELRHPQNLSLKVEIWGDLDPPLKLALIRTNRRTYLLRAPDEKHALELRSVIETGRFLAGWKPIRAARGTTVNPQVHSRIKWRYGGIARAIAKSAFNFTCSTLALPLVRNAAFDPLREFIRQSDGSDYRRFVRFFDEEVPRELAALLKAMGQPDCHALLLSVQDGIPIVLISLYQRPCAAIFLSETAHPELFEPHTTVLGLFDYRTRTHRILRLREQPLELGSALGLGQGASDEDRVRPESAGAPSDE